MSTKKIKKILYWCCFEDNLNRISIFINGLRNNGVYVYEYNINTHNPIINLIQFFKNFRKKLIYQNFDLILMHSEAHIQFILAKFLSYLKGIPLIHDIFISKFQTIYYDRQLYKKKKTPKLLLKIILYAIDLIECKFADYLILDTNTHIKYFSKKFKIHSNKFKKVFVGSQDNIFFPRDDFKKKEHKFVVGFVGTFIPLQGIKYILKAAKILEKYDDIIFHIIGRGQTYEKNKKLAEDLNLKNVKFINPVPIDLLPKLMSEFDIGLGIFGKSDKTIQVIPNKIFDGIAMKIPMITCNSPAIRELFTDNENIKLCERSNPKSLADAILKLKEDRNLKDKIAFNGYTLFKKYCTIDAIGKNLFNSLNNFLNEQRR
ncbi:MAG: glycosyltransferase [Promethearchaeota archaeon]